VDTEDPGYVDPADQWVLNPATGMYELRLTGPLAPEPPAADQGGYAPQYDDGWGRTAAYQAYGYEPAPEQQEWGPTASTTGQAQYDAGWAPSPGTGGQASDEDLWGPAAQGGFEQPPAPQWEPDPPAEPEAPAAAPPRPPAGSRRRKAPAPASRGGGLAALRGRGPAVWGAGIACGVLLVGGIVGAVALRGGGGGPGMNAVDVGDAASTVPVRNGPVNVLVLSAGPKPGDTGDSAVLLHLAAGRDNATALAIPPNLVTDIPDCQVDGKTVRGAKAQPFAAALTGRGPGCSLRTAEQLTGLQIDHVLEIDYAALPSGTKGVAAADRCVDRALAAPRTLTAVAHSEPSALTADTAIGTPETLSNLAAALGAVDPKNTTFVAMPVKGGGSAAPDTDKATQLFKMMAADVSLSAAQRPAPDPKLTGSRATAHDTRVEIYNGTGRFGASQDVLAWLQNDKHADRTTNGGDAHAKAARTTLEYAPNQADQARSLAAMMGLPASALVEGTKDAAPKANMKLTLGADFVKPGVPVGPPSTPPEGVKLTQGTAVRCS
jgi:hypothetical protein